MCKRASRLLDCLFWAVKITRNPLDLTMYPAALVSQIMHRGQKICIWVVNWFLIAHNLNCFHTWPITQKPYFALKHFFFRFLCLLFLLPLHRIYSVCSKINVLHCRLSHSCLLSKVSEGFLKEHTAPWVFISFNSTWVGPNRGAWTLHGKHLIEQNAV